MSFTLAVAIASAPSTPLLAAGPVVVPIKGGGAGPQTKPKKFVAITTGFRKMFTFKDKSGAVSHGQMKIQVVQGVDEVETMGQMLSEVRGGVIVNYNPDSENDQRLIETIKSSANASDLHFVPVKPSGPSVLQRAYDESFGRPMTKSAGIVAKTLKFVKKNSSPFIGTLTSAGGSLAAFGITSYYTNDAWQVNAALAGAIFTVGFFQTVFEKQWIGVLDAGANSLNGVTNAVAKVAAPPAAGAVLKAKSAAEARFSQLARAFQSKTVRDLTERLKKIQGGAYQIPERIQNLIRNGGAYLAGNATMIVPTGAMMLISDGIENPAQLVFTTLRSTWDMPFDIIATGLAKRGVISDRAATWAIRVRTLVAPTIDAAAFAGIHEAQVLSVTLATMGITTMLLMDQAITSYDRNIEHVRALAEKTRRAREAAARKAKKAVVMTKQAGLAVANSFGGSRDPGCAIMLQRRYAKGEPGVNFDDVQ